MAVVVRSGPWDLARIEDHLRTAVIPIRLASSGRRSPLVQSLWFTYADGALWCCTQADSVLARRLQRNPACGFEISADAPPYRGVRGSGMASLHPDEARHVLPLLIDRYVGPGPLSDWLMSRLDTEVAVRIDGLALTSWDYSGRM
jgi:nitroimidazol reductase NimA-like FMN-containing flavoprotein (pyridoxamine 5'-phosphate oxidase superfamily)